MADFYTIRELYEMVLSNEPMEVDGVEYVLLQGWIRTNRDNGKIGFIELNDGTYFRNCQIVYDHSLENVAEISKLLTGSAVTVEGKFVLTPEMKQPFEVHASSVKVEGACAEDYPLQKKRHTFEYLRTQAYLRPRTNTFSAVFRARSVLSMAIHEFFQNQGFVYVHTPIITANDAEGAGEVFTVTTRNDGKYDEDFFKRHASLTVSGQLHVEAFALAFRDVYTFGPTFRAEESNTTTHANEFWMIEPEIAFADLDDVMDLIEDMVKYCIRYTMDNCPEEMKFFDSMIHKGLIDRLEKVMGSTFARMTYSECIDALMKADKKFEFPIEWGKDLQTEHERYLTEEVVGGPVFVTDWPKDIKAFYMRLNDDGKTVAACDLLLPEVGELVGGSQREERYELLDARMKELGMDPKPLEWYVNLRRYGGCKHAGFGLGFERMLMYITGMANIRDVLAYPRTPGHLEY
ncbi:MAG: asparagine--tRNA ligase [Erysipelotrichales bacterium]|nr:asparagine--tRNA ligase [Erysipelotrichales bacterium]